ncbi:hypothetical protein DITRI_Ditri08aG0128200 [Diplodiscus trichospermus]
MRSCRLNPEAPEFFPTRNAPVSATNCPIFAPTNLSSFLYHPALTSLHPHAFSAPPFSHYPSYPYPHQHAVQGHFLIPEKAAVPVTEPVPVSFLLELVKPKTVLGEAQEPRAVAARKENVAGVRRRYRNKHHLGNERYGKEGFLRADSAQACKKEWRAKLSGSSVGNNMNFGVNVDQTSFRYPKKVQSWAANENREKHPTIPLKSDGKETTVMIRNIPNRYTREMLKDLLDQHCMLANREAGSRNACVDEEPLLSAFDFLYLPIDFVTKSNKGYAFVNFTNPGAARKFFHAWHDKHWGCFKSNKICEIYCAKLQGMEQLLKHFEMMEFPSQDFQPLSFNPARDGSMQWVKETLVGRCTRAF